MAINYPQRYDDDFINIIKKVIDHVNEYGKTIQDLVADGQLTEGQYAQLITVINGHLKSGEVDRSALNPTLRAEVDKIRNKIDKGELSIYDINKSKGKFDQTYLTTELLEQIAGTAPINAEPADGGVTNSKLANKAVTPSKTNFFERTKNLFDGGYRKIFMATSGSTMQYHYDLSAAETSNTAVIDIKPSTQYTIKVHDEHDVLRIATINGELIESGNINNADTLILNTRSASQHTFTTSSNARLLMVQTSESSEEPRLQVEEGAQATDYVIPYMLPAQLVSGFQNAFPEFEESIDFLLSEMEKLSSRKEFDLVNGGISTSSGTVEPSPGPSPTRLVVPDFVDLRAGDKVILSPGYELAITTEGSTSAGGWRTNDFTVEYSGSYVFMIRKTGDLNITPEEGKENVRIEGFDRIAKMTDLPQNTEIKYVTLNGNDSNSGDAPSEGLATLQKAVELGARKVYMERGIYQQSFTGAADDLSIYPIDDDKTDPTTEERQNIVFLGADEISGWSSFEGIYRKSVSKEYPRYVDVFVNQTTPIMNTSNRPQYNAILWESSNLIDDYVMEPVLSVDDVKSKTGTFYYDGNYIYIHPENANNKFYAPHRNKGLDLRGSKRVHLEDVTADYYLMEGIDLDNVIKVTGQNSQSNHSAYADGFSLDYTNVKFTNCKAYKNRNDGFNLHFYGDSSFINCIGEYNYDDGISHHEHCTGVVVGGSYSNNGKAGSAPVQGAKVSHYNVKFVDNDLGLLNSRAAAGNVSSGNLYKGNRIALSSGNSGELTSFNDKFIENENDIVTDGIVNQY